MPTSAPFPHAALSADRLAENAPHWPGTVADKLRYLYHANPVLSVVGWLHVALLLLALLLLPFDGRMVTGLAVWLKPAKFALSVTLYVWTLGWLLAGLPARAQGAVRGLSWGVGLSMVVEIGCVFLQAARGTTSHFNNASLFDGVVFGVMGVFILVNTLLTAWAVYLVWWHRPAGPAGYVWGVRLGLALFLAGSVLGGMMIHLNQHTVGAPDGGSGLPGLGWSTRAGDLRPAHFLGLHSLQAVPLLGWALSRWLPRYAVLLTWVGAILYATAVVGLFALALCGVPLLPA